MRYIKETSSVAICFGGSELNDKGYVDSDFTSDHDNIKSTDYVFTFIRGAVSWLSKLECSFVNDKTEYMASSHACKEVI